MLLSNLLANRTLAPKIPSLNFTLRRVTSRFVPFDRCLSGSLYKRHTPESLWRNSVCSSSTELDTRLSCKTRKRCLHPAELPVHPMNMQTQWLCWALVHHYRYIAGSMCDLHADDALSGSFKCTAVPPAIVVLASRTAGLYAIRISNTTVKLAGSISHCS